jgi:hypothetical protein
MGKRPGLDRQIRSESCCSLHVQSDSAVNERHKKPRQASDSHRVAWFAPFDRFVPSSSKTTHVTIMAQGPSHTSHKQPQPVQMVQNFLQGLGPGGLL